MSTELRRHLQSNGISSDTRQQHGGFHAVGEFLNAPEISVFSGHGNGSLRQQSAGNDFKRLIAGLLLGPKGVPVQRLGSLDDGVEEVVQVDHRLAHAVGEESDEAVHPEVEKTKPAGPQKSLDVDELLPRRGEQVVVDLRPEVGKLPGDEVGSHQTPCRGAIHHVDGVLQPQVPEGGDHAARDAPPHSSALDGDGDLPAVLPLPRLTTCSPPIVESLHHRMESSRGEVAEAVASDIQVLDSVAGLHEVFQVLQVHHPQRCHRFLREATGAGGDVVTAARAVAVLFLRATKGSSYASESEQLSPGGGGGQHGA